MSQRKHNQWERAEPIRIDGAGEEVPRPCDLVVCPECLAVRYIGRANLESRTFDASLFTEKTAKGVFCPGCDQLLFDEESWIEHLAERKHYDNELKRRKEAERLERVDPLPVAAAPSGRSDGAARDTGPFRDSPTLRAAEVTQ